MSHFISRAAQITILLSVLGLYACRSDISVSTLSGKYLVVEAEREGRSTAMLEDAYFDFVNDSTLVTNIYGSDQTIEINQTESGFVEQRGEKSSFKRLGLESDTIILKAKIRTFDFRFTIIPDTTETLPIGLSEE